jgi:hypothetical protein
MICKQNYRMARHLPTLPDAVTAGTAMPCGDKRARWATHGMGQICDLFVRIHRKPFDTNNSFYKSQDYKLLLGGLCVLMV